MTEILSNGSKFAGEEPDTLEQLIPLFGDHPLEEFSSITKTAPYVDDWQVFGNFTDLSHVFNFHTNERPLVLQFRRLFRQNREKFSTR